MGKLEKILAWQLTKVRNKNEVIAEGRKVHFASLMDLCHLKNSELEPQYQKYKGRVVLRGDIVKDDSGSYAVFTEQGSSASQMTAAKSHGHHIKATRLRRTSSGRSIRVYPGQNGRCSVIIENSKVRMSRYLDSSTKTQMAKIMVQYGRSSRSGWTESVRSSSDRTILGTTIRERVLLEHGWEKVPNWECTFVSREKGLFLAVFVDDIKLVGKKTLTQCREYP